MIRIVRHIKGRRSRVVRLDMVLAANSSISAVVAAEDSLAEGFLEGVSSSSKEGLDFDFYVLVNGARIERAFRVMCAFKHRIESSLKR